MKMKVKGINTADMSNIDIRRKLSPMCVVRVKLDDSEDTPLVIMVTSVEKRPHNYKGKFTFTGVDLNSVFLDSGVIHSVYTSEEVRHIRTPHQVAKCILKADKKLFKRLKVTKEEYRKVAVI
jgi:hypothetical protein